MPRLEGVSAAPIPAEQHLPVVSTVTFTITGIATAYALPFRAERVCLSAEDPASLDHTASIHQRQP